MLLAPDGEIDFDTVKVALPRGAAASGDAVWGSGTLADRVLGFEREVILAELKKHHNNMTSAAKALHLERSHLYKKAEQLGIDLRAVRREQDQSSS